MGEAIPTNTYRVINKKSMGTTYGSYMTLVERTRPVDHKAVLTASGTKRATSSFSYSSTFSSSISSESISSAIAKTVGFQKSVGIDISASYSIEVPAYKKAYIKARRKYSTYKGTLQRAYKTDYGTTLWLTEKTVYARKPANSLDFKSAIY